MKQGARLEGLPGPFFFNIILFIYGCAGYLFMAVLVSSQGLSLVVESGGYSSLQALEHSDFSSFVTGD